MLRVSMTGGGRSPSCFAPNPGTLECVDRQSLGVSSKIQLSQQTMSMRSDSIHGTSGQSACAVYPAPYSSVGVTGLRHTESVLPESDALS